jgi:hypothetical protein
LQRETKLVRVAATTLYGGEIGDTQGPVPDQFGFGDRQGKQLLEQLARDGAASRHGQLSSTVRAGTETTGCGRSSGESPIETAHRSLLPGLYRRSVPRPAGARSGPHVVRAGYEVVGAFKDLGRPGDSRRHLRPCGVDRSGVPPFTAMTDRRPVSTSTHAASPGDNDPVFPIWVLLAVLSCPFYGVIPR